MRSRRLPAFQPEISPDHLPHPSRDTALPPKQAIELVQMSASAPPQQEPTTAAAAASAISSAFPAPPPFYKSFTPTNIALLAARQSSDASHPPSESFFPAVEGEEEAVVGDLAHLVPPLPPQDGKYRSFGILHDVRFLVPSCAFHCPSPNPPAYIILTPPRGGADLH